MLRDRVQVSTGKLSEEDKVTLQVSRQLLTDAGLTIPELVAATKWLDEKGYIKGLTIFDENLRQKANEELEDISEEDLNAALATLDTPEKIDALKKALVEQYAPILPPGTEFDMDAVDAEEVKISDLVKEGLSKYKELRSDEVSVFLLLPFRSIDRLHKLVGEGVDPEDVKDEGVWYDADRYEFHFDEETISTYYQGKANKEHYVLSKIQDNLSEGVVWYDDIDAHKPRSLKDALNRFMDGNKELKNIFTVHSDRLEFSKEAFK